MTPISIKRIITSISYYTTIHCQLIKILLYPSHRITILQIFSFRFIASFKLIALFYPMLVHSNGYGSVFSRNIRFMSINVALNWKIIHWYSINQQDDILILSFPSIQLMELIVAYRKLFPRQDIARWLEPTYVRKWPGVA